MRVRKSILSPLWMIMMLAPGASVRTTEVGSELRCGGSGEGCHAGKESWRACSWNRGAGSGSVRGQETEPGGSMVPCQSDNANDSDGAAHERATTGSFAFHHAGQRNNGERRQRAD